VTKRAVMHGRERTFWQYFLRRSFSSLARSSMARSINERGTPPSCAAGNVSDCVPQGHCPSTTMDEMRTT